MIRDMATKTAKKTTSRTPAKKPAAKKSAATKKAPAKPPKAAGETTGQRDGGIPFPFFGAGDASYFEWADLHIYFARDPKPAEKKALTKTVPPPIGDVEWNGRHLYLSSDQGVGRQIQAAYSKPKKQPTSLTWASRFKIPDGPKLSAFNADTERYLLEAHDIVPILAAYRRQDWEAGGTQLSQWHTLSLPSGAAVLKQLKAKKDSSLEYMVDGIRSELASAKK
jgi:hypothetical protein